MKKLMIIFIIILLIPAVFAQKGHMKLLAVSELEDREIGGIADLFLQIEPGSGRVFLETFPLTRVDTQISTRFAKEIACKFSKSDCDEFDFFYTITADSAIIAGPSAGAAITILTISLLDDLTLKDDVAITGSINSGGLIGPVGGIKAKIEAGRLNGLNKILIPKGKSIIENNITYSVENLSKQNKIEIIEVSVIQDALEHFTDLKFEENDKNVSIDPSYIDTMKTLAIDLCSRTTKFYNKFVEGKLNLTNHSKGIEKNALNLSIKGKNSFNEKMYYSSASYCFGANVEYNYLLLLSKNFTEFEILEKAREIEREIKKLDKKIGKFEVKTITDLESYMVVKERLIEANDIINLVIDNINNTPSILRNFAFASERLNSAKSWSTFMDNRGKEFNLNKEVIKEACMKKISEVEERLQYVEIYFPRNLENTKKELNYAYQDLNNGDYELCLFKASKAKASVDIILSVFGVEMEQIDNVLNEKQKIVEKNLIRENENGVFSILGYSYYEYAKALEKDDPFSALLYTEYALELSDLDIYFKDEKKNGMNINIDEKYILIFILGLFVGVVSIKLVERQKVKSRKTKTKKRKFRKTRIRKKKIKSRKSKK